MNTPLPSADTAPDFRHVRFWVFDLDHTLYTMDATMHRRVEDRICAFVQQHFDLPRDPAFAMQKRYLKENGSTLAGLVAHHGVDPDVYHDFINDIDALNLKADVPLRAGLERLPGRRIVFTNNCGRFAANVLDRLGVADLFDAIVDATAMQAVPKPAPAAYEMLFRIGGIEPKTAAMFDDSARNLVPAKALGMTTVWLNDGLGQSNYWTVENAHLHIDHETDDLATFLQTIRI